MGASPIGADTHGNDQILHAPPHMNKASRIKQNILPYLILFDYIQLLFFSIKEMCINCV